MVRPEVIHKRLTSFDEYIQILKKLQKYTLEEFLGDPEHYGSTERFLQLAIESLLDIGNHVIAEESLGVVNWYSDIPEIFAAKEYLDAKLKEIWIQIIGFRNTLVHEYLDIDRKLVYEVLQHKLTDLEKIKKMFVQFL
jgi:uncharacterized protein YutE (UPF0331/DUF86 family)